MTPAAVRKMRIGDRVVVMVEFRVASRQVPEGSVVKFAMPRHDHYTASRVRPGVQRPRWLGPWPGAGVAQVFIAAEDDRWGGWCEPRFLEALP